MSKDNKGRRNWIGRLGPLFGGFAAALGAINYANGKIGLPLLAVTVAVFAVSVLLAWANRTPQAPQAKRES